MTETAEEWIKCFPIGRRIGPDNLKKKFPALVRKYGFKELCARTRAFTESHKATERKYIPHPMTWVRRGGLDEDLNAEEVIENPHPDLEHFCQVINEKLAKSQRAKGNWSEVKEITEGKHVVDTWLKGLNPLLSGWDKVKIIYKIIEAMQCGTIVTSFTHWETRLR